jgi:hypothetical protein
LTDDPLPIRISRTGAAPGGSDLRCWREGSSPSYICRGKSRIYTFLVILVAISTSGVSPTGADARPGYEVRPAGIKFVLSGGYRGGYVISVSANERQRVKVQLEGPSATVEYSTKAYVTSRRVVATFGAIGRVNVKLNITRHRADPLFSGTCTGRGARYQEGTYRGEMKFPRQGNVPKVLSAKAASTSSVVSGGYANDNAHTSSQATSLS